MNKKLMTPVFLAASFLLVACSSDTIVARPTWQNDNIIEGSKDLKDNKMKAIYDAIKNLGDTNANVLSKVMTDIAISHIGDFETLKKFSSFGDDENEIIKLIKTDEFKNFINSHKVYKADTEGGLRDSNQPAQTKSVKLDETQQGITSYYKIKQQYETMVDDIYEKLYNEIKGGSYSTSDTKLFNEEYYIDYLVKELYEVTPPKSYVTNKVFMPKAKGVTWKEFVNYNDTNKTGFLQVAKADGTSTKIYDNYIERKILPEIYKSRLTETYVKEQRFSSLGRSYARKVNMISITTDSTNDFAVPKMLKQFAKDYIVTSAETSNYNFEYITKAMIGIVEDGTTSSDLLKNNGFKRLNITLDGKTTPIDDFYYLPQTNEDGSDIEQGKTGTPTRVYEGTKLGELVKKIATCCDLTLSDDVNKNLVYTRKQFLNTEQQKVYDELTSSKYNIKKGVLLKEREIRQTDYTKDGWFLKNGGLTDISSTIRDRLFNITTSTQIDDYARKAGTTAEAKDYIKYFGETGEVSKNMSRKAFLTMPSKSGSDVDRIVLNETGNATYYIIEVEDAINTSKLSNSNNRDSYIRSKAENVYTETEAGKAYKSTVKYNEIVRDLVRANANNDTYKKNANEYYLMISNIVFYDQSVYDYFKSQFPDLFK